MNGSVICPGDKVTVTLSFNEGQDQENNNLPDKKGKSTIKQSQTSQRSLNQKEQENHKTKDDKPQRPSLVSRRTSSLLSLNIEGLLIVPEFEKRLRRNSYGGKSEAPKETAVDPSDGMLTTSLCTTEL